MRKPHCSILTCYRLRSGSCWVRLRGGAEGRCGNNADGGSEGEPTHEDRANTLRAH